MTEAEAGVTFEGPGELTVFTVPYWSKHFEELENKEVKKKAELFLQNYCIRYIGDVNEYDERGSFVCLPLNTWDEVQDQFTGRIFPKKPVSRNYNKTIYTFTKDGKKWQCNCQGWNHVENGNGSIPPREDGCQCAHTLALFLAFKLGRSYFKIAHFGGPDVKKDQVY